MGSLLKASTSSEALVVPDPILSGVGRSNSASRCRVAVFTEGSIVARVFWKGFTGTIVLVDPDAFSPTAEFVRVFLTSSSSFPSPSPSVSLLKGSPKDSSAESDVVGDAGDGEPMRPPRFKRCSSTSSVSGKPGCGKDEVEDSMRTAPFVLRGFGDDLTAIALLLSL